MSQALPIKKPTNPAGRLKRPTKEEAMELSTIMSTPPSSGDFLTPILRSQLEEKNRHGSQSRHPTSLPNRRRPLTTSPLLVSPEIAQMSFNEPACLPSFPKIKIGPPYESSLPSQTTSNHKNQFSLRPRRSCVAQKYPAPVKKQSPSLLTKHFRHDGLGPFFCNLPESILATIVNFIDYRERHPKLYLISHGMTDILTRPDFFLEIKHNQQNGDTSINFNEFLFVVGGKYPTKSSDIHGDNNVENDGERERLPRRMPFRKNNLGIMGYDLKKQVWMRFGGDPMQKHASASVAAQSGSLNNDNNNNNVDDLHPLSPFGIVDAKPLYVGHPHYSLIFFGGRNHETGQPSNRVIAYSFLTARWESFPEMMRARHGEDFVVARVGGSATPNDYNSSCNDSIVLISCDLEFCDCLRCNPPTSDTPVDSIVDMITFADNELDEASSKLRMKRDNFHSIRKCEILDLKTRQWSRSQSRAPFCPPDDGGVAVVRGRYVYLPGTCPPPPMSADWNLTLDDADETGAEIVTPTSQSETNSYAGSASIGDTMNSATTIEYDQLSTAVPMDIEQESIDVELTPQGLLYRSLHYRPGLVYDAWTDSWSPLPSRQFVTTSSPTTCSFRDSVLVLGGYRSSSENALSCYRHREEEAILDYEDHLDYAWYYHHDFNASKTGDEETLFEDSGKWKFGGGTTSMGHRQNWAMDCDLASAVAAAATINNDTDSQMPNRAPAPVRGASATTFQGRLTVLGGLSTFSRTFYDAERKNIYSWYPETREWRRASMQLPVPALLDGYAFSVHI